MALKVPLAAAGAAESCGPRRGDVPQELLPGWLDEASRMLKAVADDATVLVPTFPGRRAGGRDWGGGQFATAVPCMLAGDGTAEGSVEGSVDGSCELFGVAVCDPGGNIAEAGDMEPRRWPMGPPAGETPGPPRGALPGKTFGCVRGWA